MRRDGSMVKSLDGGSHIRRELPAPSHFANIRADLQAHGGRWGALGFWALVVYRFGRWRYGVGPVLLRKVLSAVYKA